MIKQVLDIDSYWEVVVYYNVDYNLFDDILYELRKIDFPIDYINETRRAMMSREAMAVTCTSTKHHTSIILFNTHTSKADYINSIVHEAEHVKQAMLKAYSVEDDGEPPAYTIGHLVGRMYEVFNKFI